MQEPLAINVKYHAAIDPLQQIEIGDAIDVRAAEDVTLDFLGVKRVSLGFSCKLPEGYIAILSPRSSLFDKYHVIQSNSVGIIDHSYCGNNDIWCMELICLCAHTHIPKNERIGQFIVIPKTPKLNFHTVDDLGAEDRGGFGSTGRF